MKESNKVREFGYGCLADLDDPKDRARHLSQRESTGFDDSETWNLDIAFARFIVPRLKRFKKLNNGYPGTLTSRSWNKIIQKMIDGFTAMQIHYGILTPDDESKKIAEALKLFSEWATHLWW